MDMIRQQLAIQIGRAAMAVEDEHREFVLQLAGGSIRRVAAAKPCLRADALARVFSREA